MRARELFEVVANADGDLLRELADRCLQDARARVSSPPETGLLMARVRETVDGEVFNLGEVLVTRSEVLLDGEKGWAMVAGEDPERALCGAVLDAALRTGVPLDVEEGLALQLAFVREARRKRWARVQPTRADFREVPS